MNPAVPDTKHHSLIHEDTVWVNGARGVMLDSVIIKSFDKGIVFGNFYAMLNRVFITKSNMGLLARSSHTIVNQSVFLDNHTANPHWRYKREEGVI